MTKKYSFGKEEKIKSKLIIDSLFDRNSKANESFLVFPIKVISNSGELLPPVYQTYPSLLISVSKRKFKKAVDRNLIKRRIREAYRLNKILLNYKSNIALVYVANDILAFDQIEIAVKKILKKIVSHSANNTSQ